MDFNYFYGRGADQFAFYQIPKILITDEKFAGITMESKILYSLMLDRASLSAKNGCFERCVDVMTSLIKEYGPALKRNGSWKQCLEIFGWISCL